MALINLTGKTTVYFDIYSSRTGSNLKIGLHDSGGTTTEITPNVTNANQWQTVAWNISGVSDANKDAIDSVIVTVVNADSANTFYIDNMYGNEDLGLPTVVTNAASSIGYTYATLSGNITNTGGEDNDSRGFDWGTSESYGSSWTENGTYGTGTFTHGITGLLYNTVYHFRAKSHNSFGWSYGGDQTFQTPPIRRPMVLFRRDLS